MLIHRSLKVEEKLWSQMEERAKAKGFTSTNSYIRFVLQADASDESSEEMEDRLVTTMSKLSARLQSLGTMHQASFAALWTLMELVVNGLPNARAGTTQMGEDRLAEVRRRIAGDVRGNKLLKELSGETV